MRFFNTAAPCVASKHYMLPAVDRLPWPGAKPCRSGVLLRRPRATANRQDDLTARAGARAGRFAALHFSCEAGESFEQDIARSQQAVLHSLQESANHALPAALRLPAKLPPQAETAISGLLTAWARQCPRPLVVLFDEIDALRGASLKAVLRQLRAGYVRRPEAFPQSVALCGLRDVRDYKGASGGDEERLGTSSPFNIKVASLRLGNFSAEEVASLYQQHTEATGQAFDAEALRLGHQLTGGQPWLCNALAA